jgi:hypothetical protein
MYEHWTPAMTRLLGAMVRAVEHHPDLDEVTEEQWAEVIALLLRRKPERRPD